MTKTDIANIALAKFREGRINNIESDTDPVAVVLNDQYNHALELLLEEHRWNFAGKRVTLTKLSTDPPFGWDNQYQLPSDIIRLKDVNGEDVEASSKLFNLEGDKLLTNDDTVTITYVAKVTDTNLFSPSFAEALSFKLASITCGRLTGDTELAVMLDKQYNYALSKAIHNDTKASGSRENNLMQRMLNSSPLLGGGYNYPSSSSGGSSSSSGSVAAHKHELTDLLQTSATDGQVVAWNDTEGEWQATDAASGGDVSTDAIFDAAGDLIVGDGADSAVRLPLGANGLVLKSNGTTAVWDAIAGTGDVVGDASSTDNAITRFDGTTGKAIQNSGATIDDTGNLTANNFTGTSSGTNTGDQDLSAYVTSGASVDNAITRYNGTSGKLLQNSPATIDNSGNIVTLGSVNGRNVSADGTKLDTVATNADVTDETNVVSSLSGATLTDAGVPASDDKVLIQDTSDSNNLKYVDVSDIGGGGGGMVTGVSKNSGANVNAANRSVLNFIEGSGVTLTVTDDAGGDEVDITIASAAGGGTVDTSGTPVLNDFARFTDADTIEGRSYAEVKADLNLEIGTDVQAHSSVLDATTASFLTADETNLDLNTTHRTSDGSDHTFIDQDVTTSSSPEFDGLQLDAAVSAPAHSEGKVFYDQTNKALAVYNDETDVTLQVGQEEWVRVYNATGAIIENGKVVYISGANGNFPQVTKAIATSDAAADAVGFATHDIGIAEFGYITRGGIVNGVNTVGYTAGDSVYLSATTAGDYQATAPSLPNFEAHLGHIVTVGASGSLYVQIRRREADYVEITGAFDGMSFDKLDLTVINSGGLQLEVEKVGGGNVDYLIEGSRSTLDCLTGAGTGGKARVALTAGANANTPATNYVYVTDGTGTLTLNVSSSLPTGAFGWVAKIVVPDVTTWTTTGEYVIQRYTESFQNTNRGALSHQREKLRALGAVYISGGTQTLTIDTGATPDSVHLETAAAEVYQLHRQSFPAFTTGAYYYGNGSNIYEQFANLNLALETSDGAAFVNNNRYNLVIWGAANLESGDCKLFCNLPTDVYTSDAQAIADSSATADYSVPDSMRSVAFLIARVALKYSTGGGGTFTELGLFSLLGSPVGVRAGGSAAVASTEFGDSTFRIFDDLDATKQMALQASGITTGTTRTLTVPDASGTIALTSDVYNLDNDLLWNAKGDLAVADGDNSAVILPAGTNGYVLTADSVEASGLKWSLVSGTGDFKADGTVAMSADIDMDGNNLDDSGVLFQREQAASDTEVVAQGQWWTKTATPNRPMFCDDTGQDFELLEDTFGFACSDEDTLLTTGEKIVFYAPYDFTMTAVYVSLKTAPTVQAVTVDVEEPAGTSRLTAVASIATSSFTDEETSFSDAVILKGERVSVDIDQADTGAASGLKVFIKHVRT